MYFLSVYLFFPIINAVVIVKIHRKSIYQSASPCAFIRNTPSSNDASIQSCTWECVHEYDCQTAIYYEDKKICSLFAELCERGSIQPSGNDWTSVICYRKSHQPIVTCSSTVVTTQEDEKTSQLTTITSTEQGVTMMSCPSTTTSEKNLLYLLGTTTPSTTIAPLSDPSSFWPFDNDNSDKLSGFNGTGVNYPTYYTPGINSYGSALSIDGTNGQFVEVTTYRNLSYRSFTVEMWFYCTQLTSDKYGLFGQSHANQQDQLLHFQIRNYTLYLGFYADDLSGSIRVQINTWYHAAFVFDNSSLTQKIYLNGKLDRNRPSNSYQGTSGSIAIGKTYEKNVSHYFSGYIDQVSLVMRTKTDSEILDDATLVCWYSFDDSGPLGLNGTAGNITFVNGRVNQAINFTSNLSYYQINGFVLLGVPNNSYSIALWVCPSIINGSSLIHLSTMIYGLKWCVDWMGFSSNGQIVISGWNGVLQEVVGPILPVNVWTHIVSTYSITNGYSLYINGTLKGTTGSMTYVAQNQVNVFTLANPLQDYTTAAYLKKSIVPNVYSGSIDEFRVYSRELDIADIHVLANP